MTSVASPPTTAAAELAAFCAAVSWAELDPTVQERTKELLLDLLGVALNGSQQPSSAPARQAARALGGRGNATVLGSADTTSAVWAALANGTAAHAIELDDVTTESSLHPGVAVIPAALALAEEHDMAPTRLLEAIIVGYELTIRVGNALNPASAYARGFHPTGVAGVFGATMAACRLLDLDASHSSMALGIAGTLASGSLEYLSDGAWTKRLNPGWAGHAGITAATLAQAGFSGPRSVFEGRLGVLHAYSDAAYPERLLDDLGQPLQVMRVSIKPYACCRYNHGLIDCMLALARDHAFAREDVERVRLGVLSGGAVLVADPIEQKRSPRSVVDAQFSAPYAAAVALVLGSAGLDAFAPAHLDDERVRALMSRTECVRDAALDREYPRRWPAWAEVVLRDGRTLRRETQFALGEPENPVPRSGLIDKFVSLADGIVAHPRAQAERILSLDKESSVRALCSLLRGGT